ncbi:pepsin-like aspartic protease [Dongia sp.]|uniref:pepsin-like aspartic protease n=1 Tax=Dongia sp. TaxID=1977262 RepID=UPI00374FF123
MGRVARIPITNVHADGAYTGSILVGPRQQPMNVLLDSGSAVFALDGRKYQPDLAAGDRTTRFAQYMSYSDGAHWSGGVIKTTVAVGRSGKRITAENINVALAAEQTRGMFGLTDGILGLAYAPLDEAWEMPKDTTANPYSSTRIRAGRYTQITPYLRHLDQLKVVSDIFAFYTLRSCIHQGTRNPAEDPLNQGWMVLGGGAQCREFYTGKFQAAKVLAEQWYNTNLKAIIVGDTPPLSAHQQPPHGYPSNSIVDSGTTSIDLGPLLLKAVISRFKPDQQRLMQAALGRKKPCVPMEALNLRNWPDLTFILQGLDRTDVVLKVRPRDYWQVHAPKPGLAQLALTQGEPGFAILGLPLMNGYFTIFDGEADNDRGVVKFATRT